VSCNKCTYACPRDVVPEGVMKATSHWLELKGHTPKSHSMIFDEIFSEQVIATGKIEDGHTVRQFFQRTGQALLQPWLVEMVKRMIRNLPIGMLTRMGLANVIKPRTSNWSGARDAISEYIDEQEQHHREVLGLDELVQMASSELKAGAAK
jgi:heterodisulfide reductase subunit C